MNLDDRFRREVQALEAILEQIDVASRLKQLSQRRHATAETARRRISGAGRPPGADSAKRGMLWPDGSRRLIGAAQGSDAKGRMQRVGQETLDSGEVAARLPGYRLLRVLGRGGMGVVYLAEETALDRRVAVKVLPPQACQDEEFRRRFLRESRLAAALEHPNVIPIHRAEDADGLLYIVMRYVDGPDLDTLLRQQGPLRPDHATAVLAQIAAALDAAHAAGLVHRDVKPANILLDRNSGHAYLCDFGIAKRSDADSAVTTTGSFVGTVHYASPEQIQGRRLDGRADVYALGCVLYRCLTGALPFDRADATAVMWAHVTEDPPRASGLRPGLPAAVDQVIATALAKHPDRRHPTCTALITALKTATAGLPQDPPTCTHHPADPPFPTPVPAVPPPPGPQAAPPPTPHREFPRPHAFTRRRLPTFLASLVALALVVALVTVLRPARDRGEGIGPALAPGEITTIAGRTVLPGDGGPAADAVLSNPAGIATDGRGSLYIADSDHHRVRSIDPTGVISTVAGSGTPDFSGDGGPATDAALNAPDDVAVDQAGNVYIADSVNDRVRKVGADGVITTVAGNGARDFSGDGGPAVNAALNRPSGIAVDAAGGGLYIAEEGNHRIRRVTPDGTISTIAGTGTPDFSGDGGPATDAALDTPQDVAVDPAGSLYIADSDNHRIRRVDPAGLITTVAGNGTPDLSGDGGPATDAALDTPQDIAIDGAGNLYIDDGNHLRIRKVDTAGVITTVAGNGQHSFSGDGSPAVNAGIDSPTGVAVDNSGTLYIAAAGNDRVYRVNSAGVIATIAGNGRPDVSGDNGPAADAAFKRLAGAAVDGAGNLYLADLESRRVLRIDLRGTIATVAGNGERTFSGDNGPATEAALNNPEGIAVDTAGDLYIADSLNHRIRKVGADGTITTVAGNGERTFSGDNGPATEAALNKPAAIALDPAGSLYITDTGNHRIRRIDPDGSITTIAGTGTPAFSGDGGLAVNAALNKPAAIALDPAGSLYITDAGNHRIRRIDPGGVITTVAGNGIADFSGDGGPATDAALDNPMGITFDAAGSLYIADRWNYRVRKVNPDGVITTIAGNGTRSFSGDGGNAVNATLNDPAGIAIDAAGNLYIADSGNDRVRKVKL